MLPVELLDWVQNKTLCVRSSRHTSNDNKFSLPRTESLEGGLVAEHVFP